MKIKNKLISAFLAISIIGILLISIANNFLLVNKFKSTISRSVEQDAEIIAKDIDKWMALQKGYLDEILGGFIQTDNYGYDYIQEYLSKAEERNAGNGYYIAFSDNSIIFGSGWKPDSSFKPLERVWYIDAMKREGFNISSPYIDAQTGEMVITISKAFKTKSGREGVIASDLMIDYLISLVASANPGEGAYAFLVDHEGNIVTHIYDDFIPSVEEGYKNIYQVLDGKFNNVLQTDNSRLNDKKIKDFDNIDRFFFYEDVEEAGWKVIIGQPIDNVLGVVNRLTMIIALIIAGVLLISILASLYLSHSIAGPIIQTVGIAGNIADLNLTDTIGEKELRGKDEIGQMYNSFQDIITKLRDFVMELESSVHTNYRVYEDTMDKLQYLVAQGEDTSATTQQLSAGMEETSASLLALNESAVEIDKAVSDFASKVEEGAYTSNEISSKAELLSERFITAKDNTMATYIQAREEIELAIQSSKEVEKINMLSAAI